MTRNMIIKGYVQDAGGDTIEFMVELPDNVKLVEFDLSSINNRNNGNFYIKKLECYDTKTI